MRGSRGALAAGRSSPPVITLVVTVLLFVLPLAAIAGAVAAQASQLARRLEQYVPDGAGTPQLDLSQVPVLARPLDWIGDHTGISLKQIETWLISGTRNVLEALVSSSGAVVLGAVGTIVSFILMLFVLFFVLRDGPAFANKLVGMLPIEPRRRARLWQHLQDVTRAVFMGIGLTALAQGFLVGIGFWIARLPSPLVFGVIATLFALIPVVGTSLVWGLGAIYLATQGAFGHAIFLAIWGVLVVGTADNVLRPLLISGRADVPTLAVFVGVVGGLSAFGFIGLFLGPIVLGIAHRAVPLRSRNARAGRRRRAGRFLGRVARRMRIATRRSRLALWQAEHVAGLLRQAHPDMAVELVAMTTQGDRVRDRPLAEVGGKGLFVKELELAIAAGARTSPCIR